MTVVNRAAAQTDADTIKTETVPGANTATRVGQAVRDLADSAAFTSELFPLVDTGSADERGWLAYQASTNGVPARFVGKKARGTVGSPANTVIGDSLAELVARTRNAGTASAFADVGLVRFVQADNAGRVGYELWAFDGVALRKLSTTFAGRFTTTNATPIATVYVVMPNNDSIASCEARWRGIDAAGNMVLLEQRFVYRRIGAAAPTQWGSTVNVFPIQKDDAACGTPSVSVSGAFVFLQVSGKAATNYTWDVEVTYREMS